MSRPYNILGKVEGRSNANEVVILSAHYDHLGMAPGLRGDSIFNGADDNASGVAAVLEIARSLAWRPSVERTLLVAFFTAEERGLQGSRWFVECPVVPLQNVVAAVNIETVGRSDSLVNGLGWSWLTGYEKTTVGDLIEAHNLKIVPDPRPQYNFYSRSDNFPLAVAGIPAHTLSSFGLHDDYHTVSDDVSRLDFDHLSHVTGAAENLVHLLVSGASVPSWHDDSHPFVARQVLSRCTPYQ